MFTDFRHIISAVIAMAISVAMLSLTSCRDDRDDVPGGGEGEGDCQAVFTINMGEPTYTYSESRTPTDGEYDQGSGLENYIDIPSGDYRCYLFGLDNKLVRQVEIVTLYSLGADSRRYTVIGNLGSSDAVKNALSNGCRFVFLANWGVYPEVTPGLTTVDDLCTSTLSFAEGMSVLSESNLIPMYGVIAFDEGVSDYKQGLKRCDLGTLCVLRAFAKIDVSVKFDGFPASAAAEVTSVELTRCNDVAFKAPDGIVSQEQYIHGSWFEDYTTVNIPDGVKPFTLPLTRTDDGHWYAYVPEFRNVGEDGHPLPEDTRTRIRVNFTCDNFERGGYVEFSSTEAIGSIPKGTFVDIARNNWYKFNVNVTANDIDWTVDIQPYALIELKPGFGIERDEEGNIIIRNEDGDITKIITVDGTTLIPEPFKIGDVSGSNFKDSKDNIVLRYFNDGRRQKFFSDGSWDLYLPDGTLSTIFTADPALSDGTGTWSLFDPYGVIIKRYSGVKLKADLLNIADADLGKIDVKFIDSTGKEDGDPALTKNVYYLTNGKWEPMVHVEVVYHLDNVTIATAINAPYSQKFEQKDKQIQLNVNGNTETQTVRELYIKTETDTDFQLRYRFFTDKSYQKLYTDGSFDNFTADGLRTISFSQIDPSYGGCSTLTHYDEWNHIIERWTNAVPNATSTYATYSDTNKVVKYELPATAPVNPGDVKYVIYYYIDNAWKKRYEISLNGDVKFTN